MTKWKSVPGFEQYKVSEFGDIAKGHTPIKSRLNATGYLRVSLWKKGHRKQFMVNRLVLSVFVGECPSGMECAHLDGNRTNNHVSNLKWVTCKENARQRIEHGTQVRHERHWAAKLNSQQVLDIRSLYIPHSRRLGASSLAKQFGVTRYAIENITRGRTWVGVTARALSPGAATPAEGQSHE